MPKTLTHKIFKKQDNIMELKITVEIKNIIITNSSNETEIRTFKQIMPVQYVEIAQLLEKVKHPDVKVLLQDTVIRAYIAPKYGIDWMNIEVSPIEEVVGTYTVTF